MCATSCRQVKIAARLAKDGIKGYGDAPLSVNTIRTILSNELCIGQMDYNRTQERLSGTLSENSGTVVD